jgi:hypothetical protein
MINPLQIALQGLAPGSPPITIASQGLILTITPPEEQEDAAWIPLRSYGPPDATPYDSRKGKKKRVDCVVDVEGVRGTLSCTKADLRRLALEAKIVPILAAYCLKYWQWKRLCVAKKEPATASARAQTAAKTKAKRAADRAAKVLRDDANRFAATIHADDLPNVARMLHHYILENRRMKKLLQEKTS